MSLLTHETRRATDLDIIVVVEQVLGHVSHGQNLRRHLDTRSDVEARWVELPFDPAAAGLRFPVSRGNWTIRAGWTARREMQRHVREHPPDAVVFHTQVPAMLSIDRMQRTPTILSVDATPVQYDALGTHYDHHRSHRVFEQAKHRLHSACFARARHLVTWSAWARDSLVGDYGVDPTRVTVVPPGVDVTAWRRPVGLRPSGPVRILFVGGDLVRKGGDLLIDAVTGLTAMGYGVELHLVTGDPPPPRPGIVVHTGLTPNSAALRELFHRCDVFAVPTRADCLPVVLAEAGAAGLPTVATSIGAVDEAVLHERTGLIVPPDDLDALTAALRRLVGSPDLRTRFGAAATEHIGRHFDAARNASVLVDSVREVVGR